MKRVWTAWFCVGLGGFCLSWASIFVKWCDLPPLTIAAWRLTLATVLMLAWPSARQSNPLPARVVALGGILLSLHFATWLASLKELPVYLSVTLVTTSPLWVAAGSRLLFRERLPWLPLMVAFSGTLLLSSHSFQLDQSVSVLGVALALLGAWSMAGYLLWARAHQPQAGSTSYAIRVYACSAVILGLMAVYTGSPLWGFRSDQWLWLVLLALIPQLCGHTLLLLAVRLGSANSASLSILLEPVGSIILAVWLLGEKLSSPQFIGVFLTLIGLVGLLKAART